MSNETRSWLILRHFPGIRIERTSKTTLVPYCSLLNLAYHWQKDLEIYYESDQRMMMTLAERVARMAEY